MGKEKRNNNNDYNICICIFIILVKNNAITHKSPTGQSPSSSCSPRQISSIFQVIFFMILCGIKLYNPLTSLDQLS